MVETILLCAPAGLAWVITLIVAWVAEPFGGLPDDQQNVIGFCLIPVGCLIFYLHGRRMWYATNDRDFRLLMLSLTLLVVAGVIGYLKESLGPITD